MIHSYIHRGSFGRLLFSLVAGLLALMAAPSHAQTTLNVANFGAVGDAVQFWVNAKSNSVVVTTTNQLSPADIGKTIEVFGVGTQTSGIDSHGNNTNGNQDLVATITNVVNGTNIYISRFAQATLTNTFATYGHDNATNFALAIAACHGTNDTINIPAGKYLLMPSFNGSAYGYASVWISRGGIHFLGAGMTNTILMGCGAWKLQGNSAVRGWLFACQGPIANNYPLIFDSLTMDGGVSVGRMNNPGIVASPVTGLGWDITHDAVVDSGSAPAHNSKIFQNCQFIHWRGEMVKSITSATNGFIEMTNCVFFDGNASEINFSFTLDVHNCTFSTAHQVMEFYQAYCSSDCYFRNNLVTNMDGGGIAINGAVTNHAIPNFNITSNTFYQSGNFVILTSPANNLYITGNQFILTNYAAAIGLGCAGYQGTAINSNIVVMFNSFTNAYYVLEVLGGGQNLSANVLVVSNDASGGNQFAYGYGWSTNVSFLGNVINGYWGGLNSTTLAGQWFRDDPSNLFPTDSVNDTAGGTNVISYVYGMRWQVSASKTNSVWIIDDTHPSQVPPGAVLQISSTGNYPALLYSSASMSGSPIVLTNGGVATFSWTNGGWAPFSSQPVILSPPVNFHVIGS